MLPADAVITAAVLDASELAVGQHVHTCHITHLTNVDQRRVMQHHCDLLTATVVDVLHHHQEQPSSSTQLLHSM
jgi:hypothetical protein